MNRKERKERARQKIIGYTQEILDRLDETIQARIGQTVTFEELISTPTFVEKVANIMRSNPQEKKLILQALDCAFDRAHRMFTREHKIQKTLRAVTSD